MQHHVIDATSAEGHAAQDLIPYGLVAGKQIQRQRLGAITHEIQRVFQVFVGQHRQKRAENFLGHDGVVR